MHVILEHGNVTACNIKTVEINHYGGVPSNWME